MRIFLIGVFLWGLGGSVVAAQVTPPPFEVVSMPRQINLIKGLREVSGLALGSNNSVYAHNDEYGIVYEIDLADGAIKRAFALGSPTIHRDFEGIAAENGRIYLITSSGILYEALIGEHRTRVRFNVFDTGVGAFCEVEGLSGTGLSGEFLIVCKTPKLAALHQHLVIYKWNFRDRLSVVKPWLDIPYIDLMDERSAAIFRPSAVDWDKERNALVVLSAHSQQMIVLSETGELLYEKTWPKGLHVQAEGVLLSSTGELIIAEEGQRSRPGKISIYELNR